MVKKSETVAKPKKVVTAPVVETPNRKKVVNKPWL